MVGHVNNQVLKIVFHRFDLTNTFIKLLYHINGGLFVLIRYFRYHLRKLKSSNEEDINMKGLCQKSILAIWVLSIFLSLIHILSVVLIPTWLHLLSKWIASSLGMLPVLFSTIVYYKMRGDLEQNQVHPFNDNNNETRRIEILQTGHRPFMRRNAENIFGGKSKVEILVSR